MFVSIDNNKGYLSLKFYIISLLILLNACNTRPEKQFQNNDPTAGGMDSFEVDSHKKSELKTILFFGNSLTAGYGLDPEDAYPALIQKKIDSLHWNYRVVNAGVSGETSSTGRNRIGWILKQRIDVFVLELGGNDGLRGIPVNETERNLTDIIKAVKDKFPQAKIVIAGMQIPPSMGKEYADSFSAVYRKIAEEQKVYLIPFLLDKVGGEVHLNQQDGIHPTAEGQKIVAETVWQVVKDIL